ncbi:pectinesterase [Granulicella rosea]|uniref:Pectinesterase n=1 Tax=Granulicella rosea TaxID=474952 RepID=A0A239EN60_9BACT|nr:GDSL-type esterase/lipase family protein [Granulicella rosea]SNS46180.1 pectinesterase [Granulicella rosea]
MNDRQPPQRTLLRAIAAGLFCAILVAPPVRGQTTSDPDGTPHTAPLESYSWRNPASEKIVLVGDSTVQSTSGWGDGFAASLKANAECINLAKGGRSTRTFREEGRWAQALALHPDVILLGFGHNDLQLKPDRHVDLADFRINLLRFVKEARAAGIRIVLTTPIAYRRWNKDGSLRPVAPLVDDYDRATRDIAKQENIPFLDIATLSAAFYQRIGKQAMDSYSLHSHDAVDPAHLNREGGQALGALIAQQARAELRWLAPYILPAPL